MLLRGAGGVFHMSKCILEANNIRLSFGDRLLLDIMQTVGQLYEYDTNIFCHG